FGFALGRKHARGRGNQLGGGGGRMRLTIVLEFLRSALRFDGNRRRKRPGSFCRCRRECLGRGRRSNADGTVDRFSVVLVFLWVEALVCGATLLVGLF